MRMPNKKHLIELGKMALSAYDDADRPLGQALAPLKGRTLRPPKPQEEVDADIGEAVWSSASTIRGLSIPMPSRKSLARIGARATSYIDSADLGHIGGTVEDVYFGIGRRVVIAFDEEARQLTRTKEADAEPEVSTRSTMSPP